MNVGVIRTLLTLLVSLSFTMIGFIKSTFVANPTDKKAPFAFIGKNLRLSSFMLEPAYDLNNDGKTDHDLLKFMQPCERDNTVRFEQSGRLSGSNGKLQCEKEKTVSGTWLFDAAYKIVHLKTGINSSDVYDWKVIAMTSDMLKVETSIFEDGRSLNAIMIWKVSQ